MQGVSRKYAVLVFILVAVCAVVVTANAATLTFEDLKSNCAANTTPGENYSYVVPSIYSGLIWDNFTAFDAPLSNAYFGASSGGVNGMVSGSIVVCNTWGNPASVMQTSTPMVLHSAYLTGMWNDALIVRADGYLGNVLKYSKTVTVSFYQPTLVEYEFTDIDKIEWTSWGGTQAGTGGHGAHFVMDNLSYDIVPEPSPILTLLCGLGTIGGVVLRRRRV